MGLSRAVSEIYSDFGGKTVQHRIKAAVRNRRHSKGGTVLCDGVDMLKKHDDDDCVKMCLLWRLREPDKEVYTEKHGRMLWTRM